MQFTGRKPRYQYLQLYGGIDVCLDPFPYNGGVTTCDALWMGVPVVSVAGNSYVSRQGVSLLSNVGLRDFIAATTQNYMEIAVSWARDPARLSRLRAELRERMKRSPLVSGVRFTRHLEQAYVQMWDTCCKDSFENERNRDPQ